MINVRKKDVPKKVSYLYGIGVILLFVLLLILVYCIETTLPKPLTLQDETDDSIKFIAESAKSYLKSLTDIGPRVVGSHENEVLAVNVLTKIIEDIIEKKHENQIIELDHQLVSGSYYLGYKPYGSINAYANLQNIVVKVHSENASNTGSVLVNAHYDTMPTSPGGTDDGINCAVVLESLRQLSRSPRRPPNPVLLLLNGGEESNIQASHGFATRHRWAAGARVLVNLEAVGGGGKEVLFQAGPGRRWLAARYAEAAPRPFAHAFGEELFRSGAVPSDSDFRVFRDFGNLSGYDFAFIGDGYRYHTKYDGFDNIEDGRYQRTGDNILALIQTLSESPEITNNDDINNKEEENIIFFDIFGGFLIYYGRTIELALNISVVTLSFLTLIWCLVELKTYYSFKSYLRVFLKLIEILFEWILSIAFALLIAVITGAIGRTMSWYKTPYLAIGIYSSLTLIVSLSVLLITHRFLRKDSITTQEDIILHSHLTRILWTIVILICTCYGIRSVYLLVIPVVFNMATLWIIHGFKMHQSTNWWVPVYIIGNLFPTTYLFSIAYHVLTLFIPMCGRFGTELNPDFIVGLLTTFLTIVSICYYVPLILLVNIPINIIICLISCFIGSFILVLTPVGFPYSGNLNELAPQRFAIYHTQRIFRDVNDEIIKTDSGFHFLPMDYNSPESLIPYVKKIENILPLDDDCKAFLFCGLPVTYSRDFEELDKTVWIPSEPPNLQDKELPNLDYKIEILEENVIRYHFNITGPDCMDVYMSPRERVKFHKTNLNNFIPEDQPLWNERPTLYILYVYGKEPEPLEFYVDFQIPENWNDEKVLDIAITGKYLHHNKNNETEEFKEFLGEFPEFAVVNTRALGYYESWII